jgi:hypothetical protein
VEKHRHCFLLKVQIDQNLRNIAAFKCYGSLIIYNCRYKFGHLIVGLVILLVSYFYSFKLCAPNIWMAHVVMEQGSRLIKMEA